MGNRKCRNGHERTDENTRTVRGMRVCMDCERGKTRGAARGGVKTRRTRRKATLVRPVDESALYAAVRAVVIEGERARDAARLHDVDPALLKEHAWAWVKALVANRDSDQCWRCGEHGQHDVHHRIGRKAGGTSNARIAYGPANLLLLCRGCHSWAEATWTEANAAGLRLSTGDNPAAMPVLDQRTGVWWNLTDRGTRIRSTGDSE